MNKLTSALGAIAVVAIIVVFIVQFQAASPTRVQSSGGPECAVEVRGSCLSKASFVAASRLIGSAGRQSSKGYGRRVADGLLEAWLLNQDAKRLGLTVGDADITSEIGTGRVHVSIPATDVNSQVRLDFQLGPELVRQIPVKNPKTKKFDAKYAEKQIRYFSMMSPADFREYQRSEIVASRMRELVKSRVRVGENEVFEQFSREKSTVTLDYVRFDRRFFGEMVADLSQRSVDFWADANKDEVEKVWAGRKAQVLPECRSVREIYVKLEEAATDDEKTRARQKIDHARERIILKSEDFGDVARAMSDDPSAIRGGELGCMLKGRKPKPYEEAVAALAQGKVSDVIATDGGFYLVKVETIAKDADAEKLGRAWTVKELYLTHEADRLATEASKKVVAAVKGGKSLKEALDAFYAELPKQADPADKKKDKKGDKKAEEKKGDKKAEEKKAEDDRPPLTYQTHPLRPTVETTLPFNVANDPIPGVRQSADLVRIAFGLEKPGDAPSDMIPFEGGYLAIQLKEKTPASKELWEKNKEFYLTAMRAAKANDALIAYVKRLHAQLGGAEAKFTAAIVDDKAQKGGDAPPPMDDDGE